MVAIGSICRILQRNHIPFGIITKKQLPDLDRYRVIALPSVLRMDDEETEAFQEYVRKGGRLYASGYTSLVHTRGTMETDFMLADVFGCHLSREFPPSPRYW